MAAVVKQYKSDRVSLAIRLVATFGDHDQHDDWTLGSGTAGIALMYAELFCATRDAGYLAKGKSLLAASVRDALKDPTFNFGFIDGKTGVCHVLLVFFRITGDHRFTDKACQLMKGAAPFSLSERTPSSLYEGRAGVLCVLTDLYRLRPDPELRSLITANIVRLVRHADLTDRGARWFSGPDQADGPAGWGAGTLGIAAALHRATIVLEEADGLQYLKAQAVAFTTARMQVAVAGQTKRRRGTSSGDELDTVSMTMWAHAPEATGMIPRSRLTAFQKLLRMLSPAAYNARGAGFLFSRKSANKKTNMGLNGGKAGRVYQHLLHSGTVQYPYFLADAGIPPVLTVEKIAMRLDAYGVIHAILTPLFKRTLTFFHHKGIQINKMKAIPPLTTRRYVQNLNASVKRAGNTILSDTFRLEHTKFKLGFGSPHNCGKESALQEVAFLTHRKLLSAGAGNILKTRYRLNPSVSIITVGWDLSEKVFFQDLKKDQFSKGRMEFLLKQSDGRRPVIEKALKDLNTILPGMRHSCTGSGLLKRILRETGAEENRHAITNALLEFLLENVLNNILWVVGTK